MIEQTKFTYSPFGKTQKKENLRSSQGLKQIKALEELGKQLQSWAKCLEQNREIQ